MPPTPYADVLARNLAAARARARLSQATVGERMNKRGHTAWLRQTMSLVETGKRRVTGEELFALAYVLETSVARLMSPTEDDLEVAFPSGEAVSAADAIARVQGGVIARAGVATATATVPEPTVKAE
jgi:transcriptional regulator with XRE-family HTH domain